MFPGCCPCWSPPQRCEAAAAWAAEPPLTDQQISVLLKALSGFEVVGTDAQLV
jgi:hypothetical protein